MDFNSNSQPKEVIQFHVNTKIVQVNDANLKIPFILFEFDHFYWPDRMIKT